MKVKVLVFSFIMAVGTGYAVDPCIDDNQVKEILERRFRMRHPSENGLARLLSDLNYASNRLVSAAKEVYFDSRTDKWQKIGAMSIVSSYGVPEDADFLMSCATNHEYWRSASIGTVVLLKGSTNAIDKLDSLMQITHVVNGCDELENDKGYAVECLLLRAGKADVAAADKDAAWRYALSFASNHVNQAESQDWSFSNFNSSFMRSRMRKGLLTYWQTSCTPNDYCRAYIERELGKLNQIPDSELND